MKIYNMPELGRKIGSNDLADENKLLCITNEQFILQSHCPILHTL